MDHLQNLLYSGIDLAFGLLESLGADRSVLYENRVNKTGFEKVVRGHALTLLRYIAVDHAPGFEESPMPRDDRPLALPKVQVQADLNGIRQQLEPNAKTKAAVSTHLLWPLNSSPRSRHMCRVPHAQSERLERPTKSPHAVLLLRKHSRLSCFISSSPPRLRCFETPALIVVGVLVCGFKMLSSLHASSCRQIAADADVLLAYTIAPDRRSSPSASANGAGRQAIRERRSPARRAGD